jgi:hypothetical protein
MRKVAGTGYSGQEIMLKKNPFNGFSVDFLHERNEA